MIGVVSHITYYVKIVIMSHVSQTKFDTELYYIQRILRITYITNNVTFQISHNNFQWVPSCTSYNWNVTFYVTYVTNDITYASGFLTSQWVPAYGGIQLQVKAKGWTLVQVPQSLQYPGLRNPQLNHGAAIN